MNRLLIAVAALLMQLPAHASVAGAAPPEGLLFVGLVGDEWRMFIVESGGKPRRVTTATEPRTPAYGARRTRAAYISDAGELREIDLVAGRDTVLLRPSASVAYTQPAYRPRTDELYVVALRDGSSIETDIVRVDRDAKKSIVVLQQRSAQFEPAFTPDGTRLIYSNVLCASECPKIIQEIWTMDVIGGVAEQITLLNAVSRQPAADASGAIVFASNAEGHYQLWRIKPGATARQLTHEAAVDESPVTTDGGDVYFVRRTAAGGQLMHLSAAGEVAAVRLSHEIADLRDLRWGR